MVAALLVILGLTVVALGLDCGEEALALKKKH